jgi:cysteine desulfurase
MEPSHVLVAMGLERALALGTVRFSLGHETTEADVNRVVAVFPGIVERARELSTSLGRT